MYLGNSVQLPHVCYMFGDRHLIPFAERAAGNHGQYYCQQEGEQILISNKYVHGKISVSKIPSWNEHFRFDFYAGNGKIICSVTSQNRHCGDLTKRIRIIRALTSIDIYYRYLPTRDLRIAITIYNIGENKTVHDIQIMQHRSLIRRSSGLCVTFNQTCHLESNIHGSRSRASTATVAANVCSMFLKEAYNKIKELAIPLSQNYASHAKTACIKDLNVHHNKKFAKSLIILLLRDGLYRKTMNNKLYGAQILQILQAIEQANVLANQQAMTLITNTTTHLG
ncbi:unnamed protein product [Rotaria magnacalcarata]|nr:unnamed protein product [Rotaria magnacalcarata]